VSLPTLPRIWRFGAAVLAIFGLLARASAFGADEPPRLTVLSYNIHHGEGMDARLDLKRIAEVITAEEPDIVALQEVDQRTARTGRIDQPAVLGRLTGMEVHFGANIEIFGGEYGNALLIKPDVVAFTNHKLPSFYEGEQRGLIDATLRLENGAQVRVLATHLDHRPNDEERLASVEMINGLVADEERPALLLGDLNARPDSRVMERLLQEWTAPNAEPLPTFPANDPIRQIDYILIRPKERWRFVEVRVLEAPVASDHRPILAVLERIGED